ncbi:MAG TPA: hypothetical protein VKZ66_05765, partial [Pusillimonas sp.]
VEGVVVPHYLQQRSLRIGRKIGFVLMLVAGGKIDRVADAKAQARFGRALGGHAARRAGVSQRGRGTGALGKGAGRGCRQGEARKMQQCDARETGDHGFVPGAK